jgi:protein TonB
MRDEGPPLTHSLPFDDPWHRLLWIVPAALLIWVLILWSFGMYLEAPMQRPAELQPIDAQFLEPPPPAPIQKTAPTKSLPEKPVIKPKIPEPAVRPVVPLPKPAPPAPNTPPATTPPSTTALPGKGQEAHAIFQPIPKIPDDLREDAMNAFAIARFRVATDGTATVDLITPTPNPRLNQVLLDTLKTWRFFPAMKDGIPVTSSLDLRIRVEVK